MSEVSLDGRYYHSPRCLFCGKNNRRRQTRKGRYFKCRHCGEINPGPGMMKAMMGHFTAPPADAKHANGNGHAAAPAVAVPAAAVTTIKGAAAPAKQPPTPAKPAPAKAAAAAPAAGKTKTVSAPAKKRGFWDTIADGVYG